MSNPRILIVEDSSMVRMTVKRTLASVDFDVTEAVDGAIGLATALEAATPFDLILTDLNMPNMDGLELIKAIRANPDTKFLPVIMLTTESQDDKKQAGKAAGATGWIVKPFNPEQLIAVVRKILG